MEFEVGYKYQLEVSLDEDYVRFTVDGELYSSAFPNPGLTPGGSVGFFTHSGCNPGTFITVF